MYFFFVSALQQKLIWIYQKNKGKKYAGSMNHLEGINIVFKKYIWFLDDRNVQEKYTGVSETAPAASEPCS